MAFFETSGIDITTVSTEELTSQLAMVGDVLNKHDKSLFGVNGF